MSNLGFIRKRTLFSPTSIAGCQVWFDAADTTTMGFSGASVNTWTSKVASPSVVATYSGTAPTYTTYNTYPALGFNGSSTKMTTGTIASYGAAGTTWITAAVNLTAITSSTPADASAVLASAGPPERSIRFDPSTANCCYTIHTSVLRGDINNNGNGVRGFIDTPTSFQSFINGTNFTTVNTSVTFQTATNTSFIMGSWNVGWLNGYIFECIVYDGILTLPQYQQVEGYLATKWGFRNLLPQNHPGVSSVLYPLSTNPLMFPFGYYTQFSPTSIAGCQLWYDSADPAGTGVQPSSGTTVTTWKDKSGNSNNATGQVSAVTGSDSSGPYLNFTGSTYYTIGSGSFVANQYFTIFIVERLQSSNAAQSFIGNTSSGPNNAALHIRYVTTTTMHFAYYYNDLDVTGFPAFANVNAQPNRLWSFSQLSSGRTVYLNATNLGSDTNNTLLSGWAQPLIGQSFSTDYYVGRMREILFFTGQLTTTQRQTIESYLAQKWGLQSQLPGSHPNNTTPAGTPALTAQVYGQVQRNIFPYYLIANGLIARWRLNESSGSSVYDSIGGNTITIGGSPSRVSVSYGKYSGYALSLQTSTQYGGVLLSSGMITVAHTISSWVYFTALAGQQRWIGWGSAEDFSTYGSALYAGPSYIASYNFLNSGLTTNTWYFCVSTYNGTTWTAYLNGVQNSQGNSGMNSVSAGQYFYIGIGTIGQALSASGGGGYLGEVRFYNRALTSTEVAAIYNGTG